MKTVLALALVVMFSGFLHADITLPAEVGGGGGLGFGPLTPVIGKTRTGLIGVDVGPLQTYDLSSWIYKDGSGNLVFMWQISNNTTATTISGITQNVLNWFGELFTPYNTGNYGNAEQGVLGDSGALISALNTDATNLGWGTTALAGGVDPNSTDPSFPTPWDNVFYNAVPDPIQGTIEADFGSTRSGNNINNSEHSTIWWVHTHAQNYISGNCDVPTGRGCLGVNFAIDGVSTLNGTVNIESYMPVVVPEPATLFLMGSGLVGLAGAIRRRARRS